MVWYDYLVIGKTSDAFLTAAPEIHEKTWTRGQ